MHPKLDQPSSTDSLFLNESESSSEERKSQFESEVADVGSNVQQELFQVEVGTQAVHRRLFLFVRSEIPFFCLAPESQLSEFQDLDVTTPQGTAFFVRHVLGAIPDSSDLKLVESLLTRAQTFKNIVERHQLQLSGLYLSLAPESDPKMPADDRSDDHDGD